MIDLTIKVKTSKKYFMQKQISSTKYINKNFIIYYQKYIIKKTIMNKY